MRLSEMQMYDVDDVDQQSPRGGQNVTPQKKEFLANVSRIEQNTNFNEVGSMGQQLIVEF